MTTTTRIRDPIGPTGPTGPSDLHDTCFSRCWQRELRTTMNSSATAWRFDMGLCENRGYRYPQFLTIWIVNLIINNGIRVYPLISDKPKYIQIVTACFFFIHFYRRGIPKDVFFSPRIHPFVFFGGHCRQPRKSLRLVSMSCELLVQKLSGAMEPNTWAMSKANHVAGTIWDHLGPHFLVVSRLSHALTTKEMPVEGPIMTGCWFQIVHPARDANPHWRQHVFQGASNYQTTTSA